MRFGYFGLFCLRIVPELKLLPVNDYGIDINISKAVEFKCIKMNFNNSRSI